MFRKILQLTDPLQKMNISIVHVLNQKNLTMNCNQKLNCEKKHTQMCKFDLNLTSKPPRMTLTTQEDSVNQSSHIADNDPNNNDEVLP